MIKLKIITLYFSLMFNSASTPDMPYNRIVEFGVKNNHIEYTQMIERVNNEQNSGENILVHYDTWKKTKVSIEHFRQSGSELNYQSLKTIYGVIGNEILYTNWFQSEPKYLYWVGWRHSGSKLTFGFEYSDNLNSSDRFFKRGLELSYRKKLKGNWHIKPTFVKKMLYMKGVTKDDWRLLIAFEWRKDK